jgi:hypothetical protein
VSNQNLSADSKEIDKQQPSLKSNSIQRPTLSASFYINARQMQAAACKPFDSLNGNGWTDLGHGHLDTDEDGKDRENKKTLQKLIKLLGITPKSAEKRNDTL